MKDITKEIADMAEKIEKSVKAEAFSVDLIKSTVLKLGAEGLKKAAASLSPDQKTLLAEVLADMKKSHDAKSPKESLEPASNSTPDGDYKFNEEDKPAQTEQDEKLAAMAKNKGQDEHRNQGGVPVEGWEGQVIKSEVPSDDIEKGGSGSGRKPINPAVQGVESVKNLRARAEEAADMQAKFKEGEEGKKIEKSEDEIEAQPEPSLEDKKKVAKANLKKMMSRMQERKLEKSACVAALAKSYGVSETKLYEVWDVLAKSDVLPEKGNPEGSQSAVPAQMKGDEGAGPQTAEDPSVPKYKEKKAAHPEFDDSGKPKTLADKGEQPPSLKKSDAYFHEEEPVYFAKSESNPFAVRTIKPNAVYNVDQMIEDQASSQAQRLAKSTFDYDDGSEVLRKSDDPTEVDVVEANAKKKADGKRENNAEVRAIKVDEKLSRIEGNAGPKMPFVKSQTEELISKGLDMDQGKFDLAVTNSKAQASGGFLVKSFDDSEMDALFGEQDMWKAEDLEKSNAILEKSGEGSRGGKIIGHTKSGKPIYDSHGHAAHAAFTAADHSDARDAHDEEGFNHFEIDNAKMSYHQGESAKHGSSMYPKKEGKPSKPKAEGANTPGPKKKHKEMSDADMDAHFAKEREKELKTRIRESNKVIAAHRSK